jgi:hypothetical protein
MVVKGDAPRVRATGRFYKQALDRRTRKPFTQPARIGRSGSGMRLIHDAAHNVKEMRAVSQFEISPRGFLEGSQFLAGASTSTNLL